MQELLKFKMRYGRPCVLVPVPWAGLDAASDTWEPLDNLTNCEAQGRHHRRRPSNRQPAARFPAGPAAAECRLRLRTYRSRRQDARSMWRRPATWARRWLGGLSLTRSVPGPDSGARRLAVTVTNGHV